MATLRLRDLAPRVSIISALLVKNFQSSLRTAAEVAKEAAVEATPFDTGELAEAWTLVDEPGKVVLVNDADHAVAVDLGTSDTPPAGMTMIAIETFRRELKKPRLLRGI